VSDRVKGRREEGEQKNLLFSIKKRKGAFLRDRRTGGEKEPGGIFHIYQLLSGGEEITCATINNHRKRWGRAPAFARKNALPHLPCKGERADPITLSNRGCMKGPLALPSIRFR